VGGATEDGAYIVSTRNAGATYTEQTLLSVHGNVGTLSCPSILVCYGTGLEFEAMGGFNTALVVATKTGGS
jgi:hypothetical protein